MEQRAPKRRRKPKTPLALWIVESREALPSEDGKGWTSDQLADGLGVAGSTVRGWESGRAVSEDSLREMERLFGTTAPGRAEPSTDYAAIVAAIDRQTAMLERVLRLLAPSPDPENQRAARELEEAARSLSVPVPRPENHTVR